MMFGLFQCLYLKMSKYFRILCLNPFKTQKLLKGVFKPLSMHFFFGKIINSPILYNPVPGKILSIFSFDVLWKDKYDTPRFEQDPYIFISFFKWCFIILWKLDMPHRDSSDYWEQAIWYLYYYNNISYGCNEPNIEKAKESWPWEDYYTKQSTWNDEFLIK